MKCKDCNSPNVVKNGFINGVQQYKCKDCGSKKKHADVPEQRPKVGMTLEEFREKHDVDYIVKHTLDKLDPNMIYEKNDIIKLTGLRPGYPGLTPTIENQKSYYGKVGSMMYFSHPKTIAELKEQAKLM